MEGIVPAIRKVGARTCRQLADSDLKHGSINYTATRVFEYLSKKKPLIRTHLRLVENSTSNFHDRERVFVRNHPLAIFPFRLNEVLTHEIAKDFPAINPDHPLISMSALSGANFRQSARFAAWLQQQLRTPRQPERLNENSISDTICRQR